ncbi:conserved hypothetical protein [Burkholderiales bacterium 8X]|nr:conserved hypothetical protein [Burkholderiales bacterium 8X]
MNAASLMRNRWTRRVAVTLLVVLLLWLVAWLAVPPIAKSQLQKIASEKLGRQVTVGKIDFKPWTLELALDDLKIAGADGGEPQASVARIYVDAELQSILRLAPVIDAVQIESPAFRLSHLGDGKYDIDDILARLKANAAPETDTSKKDPPRFAVYNIVISNGRFDFDDRTVKRKHELRDLTFKVPFLSNLASQREVKTEPKLAFVLNGSRFDSSASTTPFADNRKTNLQFQFADLDLAPYLGYLPGGLPIGLKAGRLDANIQLDFEQAATAGLKLSGSVAARGVQVADSRNADLLAFDALEVAVLDARPLERNIHLGAIRLDAPKMVVARDAAGKLNLIPADSAAKAPAPEASAPAAPAATTAPVPWQVKVDRFSLTGGNVGWRDASIQPSAAIDAEQLAFEASDIAWPLEKPVPFSGSSRVGGARLGFKGQATDKAARLQAEVEALPLSLAAPYLAKSLSPTVDGKLSGQVEVDWAQPDLKFRASRVAIDGLALTEEKSSLASIGRFELLGAEVDMTRHTLAIGTLSATQPKIAVERGADKRWMFERWLKAPAAAGGAAAEAEGAAGAGDGGGEKRVAQTAAAPASAASASKAASAAGPTTEATAVNAANAATAPSNTRPWALSIGTLAIDNGSVSYADKSGAAPVAFDISALKVNAQKISPDSPNPSPLALSGRISSGRADAGRFDYKGSIALKPLAAEGQVELVSIPAHAFKAYYADALNIDIRRAFANFKGTVKYAGTPAGMNLALSGDSALEDFRANNPSGAQATGSRDRGNQVLRWKALSLRALKLDMVPKKPVSVSVRETTLTDFFARVIVDPTGRLNLQDLARKPGDPPVAGGATEPGGAIGATAAADATKTAGAPETTTRRNLGGSRTTVAAAPAAAARGGRSISSEEMVGGAAEQRPTAAARPAASSAEIDPNAPVIDFGPMNMVNGRIDFTDLFVKPNYSADLSELNGKLSAFSSQPRGDKPALAELELRGKAQQTAALEITGRVNPLAKPLELDITAKMRDLDLPPLSPYSVRYAGHGIERGKLSMEVNYQIAPDGRLTATNKLVLNQLQFGDPVEGAPNSLPVRLAVALLADRNGVIDIDFPISGSLNDPQFSIGPLIFKAIANLIVKAVTSPFSLLTGGLGGGGAGDSSAITFSPGSASLTPEARENLDKVAKALAERETLRLTISGMASLEQEKEAYQRRRLRELAQSEKRRAAVRGNQDAAAVSPVTDAEYPELLAAVYKRTEIEKPRNLIGLAKDLPVKDMEDLLLPTIQVDEETMRQLAVARGAAVRDYLLAQKLPSERIFLGAVRSKASGADWKPGADLNLSAR